jgi:predicted transcriptional regulator
MIANQKKDVTLSLKVTQELKDRLRSAARKERRSMNWLASELIERGLAKRNGKKRKS